MSLAGKNKTNRRIRLFIALLVAVDLISKYLIFASNIDTQFMTPVMNTGGAWSLTISVPIIIAFTAFACAGMIYLWQRKHISSRAFAFLMAGALGNVYDRIVFHGVRDRIHIGVFPVFNLADVMITIGVLLIAFQYKKQSRMQRS